MAPLVVSCVKPIDSQIVLENETDIKVSGIQMRDLNGKTIISGALRRPLRAFEPDVGRIAISLTLRNTSHPYVVEQNLPPLPSGFSAMFRGVTSCDIVSVRIKVSLTL